MNQQRGFTLIELMVVIAIIGILAGIGLSGLKVYRNSAAYTVADMTLYHARSDLEASITNVDTVPPAVGLVSQNTQGPLQDSSARALLPSFFLPPNIKFQVSFDPTCDTGACTADFMQVNHCTATEHIAWMRLGNGVELRAEHVAGGGCS